MAILKVVHYPDPVLKQVAKPVKEVNDEIKQLVKDMLETMYHDEGAGLAANQVNQALRVMVIDDSPDGSNPMCFINPEIIHSTGHKLEGEGCLSFPGLYIDVERATNVTCKALNENGEEFTVEATGLLAKAIQHELDHINGITFIDRISSLKRQRAIKKLQKMQRYKNL
jgi:peptide deformylase